MPFEREDVRRADTRSEVRNIRDRISGGEKHANNDLQAKLGVQIDRW